MANDDGSVRWACLLVDQRVDFPHHGFLVLEGGRREARPPGIPPPSVPEHGGFRPRPNGLKQFAGFAKLGAMPLDELAPGRVRA